MSHLFSALTIPASVLPLCCLLFGQPAYSSEKDDPAFLKNYFAFNQYRLLSNQVKAELMDLVCSNHLMPSNVSLKTPETEILSSAFYKAVASAVFLEKEIAIEAVVNHPEFSNIDPATKLDVSNQARILIAKLAFGNPLENVSVHQRIIVSMLQDRFKRDKPTRISIIAAMTPNRGIGLNNQLPWDNMPHDYQRMLNLSRAHHVIMGRKTFEEINGQPIAGCKNIIVSHQKNYFVPEGVLLVGSLEEALAEIKGDPEPILLGGGLVYKEALEKNLVDRMYLTYVKADLPADTFFPEFDEANWKIVERKKYSQDDQNKHDYEFVTYDRID